MNSCIFLTATQINYGLYIHETTVPLSTGIAANRDWRDYTRSVPYGTQLGSITVNVVPTFTSLDT